MAPDDTDQDHRQKSGREELEDALRDQIGAKEQEIRGLRDEIKPKEQEIRELREEIIELREEIIELREEIRELREEIRELKEELRAVEKEIATASGTEVRKPLEAKVEFLRQEISSRNQQIINRDQQINSLQQEISSLRSVQEASTSAEPPLTVQAFRKEFEDAMTKFVRDSTAKSEIIPLAMSSVTTKVAHDILKMADFTVVDGSALQPAGKVSVSKEWEFDMGQYAREEDCYEPFFKHMVEYLNTVHAVKIQKDPPLSRGDYCRLLDVHKLKNELELGAELGDRTLKITGNLDAVFVPRKRGLMEYTDSVLGGIEVKHSTAHKEIFKGSAPTVGTSKSGQSPGLGQALIETLAVYAYSNFPRGIFLLTSYDENTVMELKDMELWCWTELNFAQAMDKIAAFLKSEDVQKFLEESEKPVKSRQKPHISESKRSVRKKLKIELGNEEFLEQVDVIRSTAGNKLEMVSDLLQLVESWRYSAAEACGSAGPLSYFA